MSGLISFTKMHGLGNDFVVIDAISQSVSLSSSDVVYISNRHRGIGCDQILLILKSDIPNIDFIYKIYNSDGSEVGQCGNGARCLAKFIRDKNLSSKNHLRVKTFTSILELVIQDKDIKVNMGIPEYIKVIQHPFALHRHFLKSEDAVKSLQESWIPAFTERTLEGTSLSLGNPHIVFVRQNIQEPSLNNLGLDDINIGYMQIIDKNNIKLRVFERGVGETQACGSGACAAVVAGITQNLLDPAVTVELQGGKLYIQWQGQNQPVWMTGPAENVFEGKINLP